MKHLFEDWKKLSFGEQASLVLFISGPAALMFVAFGFACK